MVLDETKQQLLRSFQEPDEALYLHFKDRLNQEIKSLGQERFNTDLNRLRRLQEEFLRKCDSKRYEITWTQEV